ncbi:hypothetical protein PGT21_026288 [Puccinia graminis f. sp. tritici]|uniref:Uncharacterized protein n=1 Tax=Puccinia graminis f. sp. tritici TaxID=56615 RepID=A0A5B0NW07_PUCGR|nr:hypothetical protein PGT21_026288 [Puccinia graminis f. sp. tritici]KAA1135023.1 hypothetical protein PGTUg99_010823 [Puccinia graminis f. sp. tritici]
MQFIPYLAQLAMVWTLIGKSCQHHLQDLQKLNLCACRSSTSTNHATQDNSRQLQNLNKSYCREARAGNVKRKLR